ncbi:hypothetical protein P152DRAFT_370788, partial [Eremomyces bilateralis CBS 781.70]
VANGRTFGGHLTNNATAAHNQPDAASPVGANPQAPVFVPGRPYQQPPGSNAPHSHSNTPRQKRRMSRSSAPDISTRIREDIDRHLYECSICMNEVHRNSKIWSCRTCWSVFHFGCVKKWSSGQWNQPPVLQNGEEPPRHWRCPGCNLPKDTLPTTFNCWCDKETDPQSIPGLPPFSCGQTCAKPRVRKCPHPCETICHPGPCTPCTNMGTEQSCFCGRESATRRCVDTDYEGGWSCQAVCGELMACGEHTCPRPCHPGLCGPCQTVIDTLCYCGKDSKTMVCSDQDERKETFVSTENGGREPCIGCFHCGSECERLFDCGVHSCSKGCHTQDEHAAHCPKSPDIITHCPCGKTKLMTILDSPRTSCTDPIPFCGQRCSQPLPCGHVCKQSCHEGPCRPCTETIQISCRCGRTTSKSICHQGTEEKPQCLRVCRATLSCGRHTCAERCCEGEKAAAERMSQKRKLKPLSQASSVRDANAVEEEHICTLVCGRMLRCGNHSCTQLCHSGPCPSCPEAIFEEVSCACGRTVLQPPLPCGTQPPPCHFDCERPKSCGHPQVSHRCHLDAEPCPKCPFLMKKRCLCARNELNNQPCWFQEVRCGEICGQKLRCGFHRCRKQCHRPGECETVCDQPCGKERSSCGHSDLARCHAPGPCDEGKPCPHKIFITCPCQRVKQETKCLSTKSSVGNREKALQCNDECLRLERNRKLALALNVDPDHEDDHVPYATQTLNFYAESPVWAQEQEQKFRIFAADPDLRRLRFSPMKSHQRAFLHHLAEDFSLDSESLDPEPHRHVVVFKTPRFVSSHMKTIAEANHTRNKQRTTLVSAVPATAARQAVAETYNAFLITDATFGLTADAIQAAMKPLEKSHPQVKFDIDFLPNENVVIRPATQQPSWVAMKGVDAVIQMVKAPLQDIIRSNAIGKIQLCRVDESLRIMVKESEVTSPGGWSQVAAKASAPQRVLQAKRFSDKNAFTVLRAGLGKSSAKKVVKKEEVIDDWEDAEEEEEA